MTSKTDLHAVRGAIDLAGGPVVVAKSLGVARATAYAYRTGTRMLPVELCATLEALCGGVVSRRDLRPHDWRRVWPELAD